MMYVFDCEGNGLTPDKFYCLVYHNLDTGEYVTLTSHQEMKEFLEGADVLIGHNIIRWDIPNLERVFGVKVKADLVDTLALSWYLYPERPKHGLEEWGNELGIEKPEIKDWHTLTLEEYVNRCQEDVKINTKLWHKQYDYLSQIYETKNGIQKLINYLSHKLHCARLAEESRWRFDGTRAATVLFNLEREREERFQLLAAAMPRVAKTAKRTAPAKPNRKDGTLSSSGEAWKKLLKDQKLPPDTKETTVVVDWEEPNPNSHPQVKDWLFSLGWEPQTFKYDRDKKTNDIRKIPQISNEDKDDICESVKLLVEKEPAVEQLGSYFLLGHRISLLKGLIKSVDDNGYIAAEIAGLTNTLRFRHQTVVNLPKPDKPYGKEIRGCFIAPDGYEVCGADMSSLEDRTKQHFIYPYDKDYVEEMNTEDFDPHLDIAVRANMMSQEDSDAYKRGDHSKKPIRSKAKSTNYAATYGAGPPRIALTAGIPLDEAKKLHEAYWSRNWAIKAIAENTKTKYVGSQQWLFNPVSRLWYSLRSEKDKFSTLNQGTATYCFDTWVWFVIKDRQQLTAQFHDEIVLCVKKGYRKEVTEYLQDCINKTNEHLKLNRELGIGIEFGDNYAEVH